MKNIKKIISIFVLLIYIINLSKQQCSYLSGIDFNVNNLPNGTIKVKSIDECKFYLNLIIYFNIYKIKQN